MNAASVAAALGGKKVGHQWLCRCPAHDDHHPSMTVGDGEDGSVLWHCKTGCDGREIGRALHRLGLLPDRQRSAPRPAHFTSKPAPAPRDDGKPQRFFDRIGQPIEGTPVERYLRWRCPDLVVMPSSDVVRYFPASPPAFPFPAMVALVTDLADANRVLTLHSTFLLPDGSGKAPVTTPKRTLKGHSMKGGIIRLTDDAEVTLRLGFAEGIEKALSIMTSIARDCGRVEHVWAALNAPNMGELPVLAGIETLVIYGDANPAGRLAKGRLAQRWLEAGREVFSGEPPGSDWDEYDDQ